MKHHSQIINENSHMRKNQSKIYKTYQPQAYQLIGKNIDQILQNSISISSKSLKNLLTYTNLSLYSSSISKLKPNKLNNNSNSSSNLQRFMFSFARNASNIYLQSINIFIILNAKQNCQAVS